MIHEVGISQRVTARTLPSITTLYDKSGKPKMVELVSAISSQDEFDFLTKNIIPIGSELKPPLIPISDFLNFPLAKNQESYKEDCFKEHKNYLSWVKEHQQISEENYNEALARIPKQPCNEYDRYFDIFPNEKYDDAIMMAVYSLWQNNSFQYLNEKANGKKQDNSLDDIKIPVGVGRESISARELFALPLAPRKGPKEESDWFDYHFRYLEYLKNQKSFPKKTYKRSKKTKAK